jgi:hypothetical protein
LLLFALTFAALQCVASCAAADYNSTLPPCHQHQHHGTSNACPHDFQLPDVHRSSIGLDTANAVLPPGIAAMPSFIVTVIARTPASSPPDPSLSSSTILRL